MSGLKVSHAWASSRDPVRRLSRVPAWRSPHVDVIESKLHAPPLRAGIVSRRALFDRLSSSPASVVAILAAAGYGKTTLLSEWSEAESRAVAWVSLDGADNDPVALLSHGADTRPVPWMQAGAPSYERIVGAACASGVTLEEIAGVVIAMAPAVGVATARQSKRLDDEGDHP